jgi:hypothetical protein
MLKSIALTTGWINAIAMSTAIAIASSGNAVPSTQGLLIAKSIAPKIGIIKNSKLITIQGTFCDLQRLKDPHDSKHDVFLSAYQGRFKSKALMNIDGKDVVLSSIKEAKNQRGSVAFYQAGNLKVKVNYVRTSPEMEGASYHATIVVTRGKSQTTIKTQGACGI